MREAITRYAGVPAERLETLESVRDVLVEKGLPIPAGGTYGHLLMGLFEQTVEEHLFAPAFITDYPTEVSPLSKQRPDDPRFTERFELYIAGMEIANAFSELNDPDVQAERFRQQVAARATGDAEAHLYGRRLRARPGARHAARGRHRHRHRPPGHAAHRPAVDPRRDPVPADAAGSGRERPGDLSRPSRLLLRRLPFPALIALRYLRSTRRDAFASFLSIVAAGGLALGVAAMVLSLAVISGFQSALRSELLGRTPQIEVELPPGADAAAARQAALRVSGVVSAQIQVRGGGWLVERGKVQPVELVGFDGRVPRTFPGAAGQPEGLYVPATLAARWGLKVGGEPGGRLAAPDPHPAWGPAAGAQRLSRRHLRGRRAPRRRRSGSPCRARWPRRCSAPRTAGWMSRPGGSTPRSMRRPGCRPALPPGSVVRTWKDLNRPLLFALRLEKLVMFVAVSLIVLVASLALVADLALIISSKRPEIGMLGTLGATPAALRQAFVLLGGLVAGTGVLAGTVLGVGGAWVMNHYRLLKVPGRVYFLDYVPFLVQPEDLVVVLLMTFALALASSLYAAQRAAALDPVEALRR